MDAKKEFTKLEKVINKNLYNIFITSIGIILLLLIINIGFFSSSNSILKDKIDIFKEANKPAKIEMVVIDCDGCSDIVSIVDTIKNKNVELTDENLFLENSNEAKELITKYGITKLPTVIITGDIEDEKTDIKGFYLIDDAKILTDVAAPYLDVTSNEIKGKVEIIEIVDSSCEDCVSLDAIPTALSNAKVFISGGDMVEYNSAKGKELISKYGIKHIPEILISKDIDYYPDVKQGLLQLGIEEKQGFYAIHSTLPPYRNLTTGKIDGIVDLIMLTDDSCSDCYDVNTNKQILKQFGIILDKEEIFDISSSEGKQLISKYNLEKVPMIIVSPEAKIYSSFVRAWSSIGSVEDDGWFVMRRPEIIGEVTSLNSLEES